MLTRCRTLAFVVPLLLVGATPASSAASTTDPSFGAGGEQIVTLNGGWYSGGDAVRTADDKIVVAGYEDGYGLAVARFTTSGQRDTSFGTNGVATFPLSATSGEATGVTTDAAGSVYVALNEYGDTGARSSVRKITSTGQRATGFGAAGAVDLGQNVIAGGIRLSPSGDRVYVSDALTHTVQVRALDPATGALDSSFNGDGIASIAASGYVRLNDLVVRPADGQILVAGSVTLGAGTTMLVGSFLPTGAANTSFGDEGLATPFLGSSAEDSTGYDLFALADGTTYVVGAGDSQQSYALTRIKANGQRDTSFGYGGLLTDYAPGTHRTLNGVNVQGDGAVVVTGSSHLPPGEPQSIVRRYLPSGAIDPSFADGGTFTRPNTYAASALVAQTSGAGRYVQMAFEDQPGTINQSQLVLTGLPPQLRGTELPDSGPGSPPGAPGGGSAPGGGTPGGGSAPSEAPVAAGCTRSIVVGPLEVRADCFKREGLTWTTGAAATVGGLSFVPNGAGAQLVIDPLNLRIAAKGSVKVQLQATLYGRTLGPVTVAQGAFDWTFQYRPDLTGLARLVMPQPGSGGQAVSLATLKGLPGLSGVSSLPKLDLGLPDFSKLSTADVSKLAVKVPSLGTANVQLPLSLLGVQQLPELRFQLPAAAGSMLGFPVRGDIGVRMSERGGARGVDASINLALPAVFGGITGNSKLFIGAGGQVIVDALGVDAAEVTLPGAIRVAPVKLGYNGATDTWTGATNVFLGYQGGDTGLGGSWVVQGGQLKRIGVTAAGIPLGSVATVDQLNANLTLSPTRVFGGATVGFGPKIPALNARAVNVNGTFDFNGDFAKIGGNVAVANIPLASASAEYWWNGYFAAQGKISYFLDAGREYGFTGTISGEASKSGFNAEGSVSFKAKGHGFDGKGLVSSKGIAGCAKISGFLWQNISLGAGYKWGAQYIDWIGGACDFGPYRANIGRAARLRRADQPVTVTIGKGKRAAALKVFGDGASGAPQFTLTGPGGMSVATPADGSTVTNDHFVVIQQPSEHATYVAIAAPKAGRWTVTPAAGSTLRSVESADALPPVQVTGRINRQRLTYTVAPIKGQVVRLVERGAHTNLALGTARGSRGSVALRPNAGAAGRRDVVAVVEQDGMVRATVKLARYTAHPKRLPAPKVTVARGKRGIAKVRWTPVPGANGYTVVVELNGRKEQRTVTRTTRHVEIPGLLVASGVKATVTPLGGPTKAGKSGHGTIAKPKVKARKKPKPAAKPKSKKKPKATAKK